MADDSSDERTEEPSSKKRHEARQKGNIAKSQEINSVVILLASLFLFQVMGEWLFSKLYGLTLYYLRTASTVEFDAVALVSITKNSLNSYMHLFLPFGVCIMVAGIIANIVQVGFLMTHEPLVPRMEKINPLDGMKRLFSLQSIVEALKGGLKISIILIIASMTIIQEIKTITQLLNLTLAAIWATVVHLSFTITFRIILALLVLAVLDYAYQRFQHEKKLRMTKQEVKEERKQIDGDPAVKSRIRSLQREMARRRMMNDVPKATVVVTNPTHIAIAIRYEAAQMDAPRVVAKGKLLLAQRIREIALQNNIPIVEDKKLARALYDVVEPGDAIPVQFYTAVAEILAYVYRLKKTVVS
ncbi:MAG: flagellar biosynthesis protein FlhB [Chitinivibrionales bacterium]|nr:flagellar biosynthesis protein FlhB [Chitinivibrionales bacterium]